MAWQVDMAHTQVAFAIRHLGISLIRGNMALADARLDLDEADPENTELTARIDVRTLDTHDANRDGHVKSADFFDVDKFPYIEFRTKNVRRTTNGKLNVTGDLTIKDVTRELRLQGSYDGPVNDPVSGKRKIGFALSGDVLKQDYGLSWNVPMESSAFMLADRVSLTIDAQAIEA
jgi:polyisoprenoid-binding protein YceI